MFRIIIGADIVPTKTNYELFENADVEALVGSELLRELEAADFRIFNLETPICDELDPIPKTGPNLVAPTSTFPGIAAFKPSLLTLANNHILDQGVQGIVSTLNIIREYSIPFIGAGMNLAEAEKPYIFIHEGKKIGIFNCAEHEFTIATETTPGANPFDFLDGPDKIAELREKCDYIIIIYHGGKEHYRYPSPNLKKVCRKMVDKGADVVLCQHTHCISCMEEYNGSVIVYGQGNFLFDHSNSEYWQTSILAKIDIDDGISVDYIPIRKHGNVVRLASPDDAKEIMDNFYSRSDEIKTPGFIEENYKKYCMENCGFYLHLMAGGEKCLGVSIEEYKPCYDRSALLALHNIYRCEPHRELVITALRTMSENYDEVTP
ncbi:MAG: CapA family protein [Clostridiales bacterium]|nr:CapA family protein [Clostridiales bacterium]